MLKRILGEKGSKALLVLPYVALVQEKVRWLRNIVQGLCEPNNPASGHDDDKSIWRRRADQDTIRVVGFFGGGKVRATWQDFDIGVCTLEKVRNKRISVFVSKTKSLSGECTCEHFYRRLLHPAT
jgi:hypothetical protein